MSSFFVVEALVVLIPLFYRKTYKQSTGNTKLLPANFSSRQVDREESYIYGLEEVRPVMLSENLANIRLKEVRTLQHLPVLTVDRLAVFT